MTGNPYPNPSLTALGKLIKEWWGGEAADKWYAGLIKSSSTAREQARDGTLESTRSGRSTPPIPQSLFPGTPTKFMGLDGQTSDIIGLSGEKVTSKPDENPTE